MMATANKPLEINGIKSIGIKWAKGQFKKQQEKIYHSEHLTADGADHYTGQGYGPPTITVNIVTNPRVAYKIGNY
jgi:hypothetical protein